MLSTVIFFVVAVLVCLGVLWWSGDIARGALIGVICGSAAAFMFGAVITAMGRSGERSSNEDGDLGMDMIAEQGMPLR